MGVLTKTLFSTDLGDFVFDAIFSVDHELNLTITEQPVQTGVNISDHAYMEANQVIFDIGMSDVMQSQVAGQFGDNASRSVSAFTVLQTLQTQRLPIQVTTRLAAYSNMLVATISCTDDSTTGNGMRATVTLQEIIVVNVGTVSISARPQVSTSTSVGDQAVQSASTSIAASLF